VKQTSARLLRLLALLQTRREWSGNDLAERLDVTVRTVRRDIEKLRELDYPINAVKGIAGGYRLGAGAQLPPLLLDDEEAVAVAIALRTATMSSVTGIGETALRALVKLEQVLPARLRLRIDSVRPKIVATPRLEPDVDTTVLTALGAARRDQVRIRFNYESRESITTERDVEPHELVIWGPRWYLVAWDVDRNDWRTFRVDRVLLRGTSGARGTSGPRFHRRRIPGDDPAAFLARSVADLWPYRATLRLHTAADSAIATAASTYGRIEPVDEQTCLFHVGSDHPHNLAINLSTLDVEFDVLDAPELVAVLREIAGRYRRATEARDR
jgi:predicted DNA-binding transcriptional regulator YafY